MPFIAGEIWTVGGTGSFYGNGKHCNADPFNDYYATDWNRVNDLGAAVLPVADGTVSDIVAPPNCPGAGYGCYVRIDHADGYRTLYAHLSQVLVTNGASVHTWTLIGKVGDSGVPGSPHLHLLSFE
jgi:murein DD-endopeptidase MepM/ murein hydrolase activator NlpD